MADLQELIIRLRADTAQFQREMDKATSITQSSGAKMSGALANVVNQAKALVPALSVGALVAFSKSAFEAADRLNDLSQRTGVAASTLSALNISLLQSGSNVEEFSASINRMNNLVGEAAKGSSQEAIKAFDDIGLSVRKLQELSPEQQFYEISRALGETKSQAEFTNAGMAIFGRSFASIAPLIKEAGGNLEDFVEKLKSQGSALTPEQLKRINEYGDKWVSVWEHAKLGALSFLDVLFQINDWVSKQPSPSGAYMLAKVGIPPSNPASGEKYGPNLPGKGIGVLYGEQFGPSRPTARGSNQELLKQTKQLTEANKELAKSNEENAKAMQEAERFTSELKDQFAQTASSIMFDSKNAGDAVKRLTQAIAEMIAKRYILGPLFDSLLGSSGSGGSGGLLGSLFSSGSGSFFSGLGFADGGTPPLNQSSIVGENGPELFVPKTMGTIVPGGGGVGGGNVVVHQYFQVSNDVPALIQAHIKQAAPVIASAAHDAVFTSMKSGGSASKIAGLR